MKQRLGIAEVLVKKPTAIILDEPTLGIDPDGAIRIFELIRELQSPSWLDGHAVVACNCNRSSRSAAESVSSLKASLIVQGEMDTLGKSILKGREWNFLVEVSGSTDGFDRELQRHPRRR